MLKSPVSIALKEADFFRYEKGWFSPFQSDLRQVILVYKSTKIKTWCLQFIPILLGFNSIYFLILSWTRTIGIERFFPWEEWLPTTTRSNKAKVITIEDRSVRIEQAIEREAKKHREQWPQQMQQLWTMMKLIKGKAMVNELSPIFHDNGDELPTKDNNHSDLILHLTPTDVKLCL